MRHGFAALLAATLLLMASPTRATVYADQSFDGCCVWGFLADGFSHAGQTVTAGATGRLVRVEMSVTRSWGFDADWILDVRELAGAHDDELRMGALLSSTVIRSIDIPLGGSRSAPSLSVDLPSSVFFRAGDSFAIVLHPKDVEGIAPHLSAGLWSGGCYGGWGRCYTGGEALYGMSADTLYKQPFDFAFVTYISPVPEPETRTLMLAALIGFALIGRLRSHKRQRA